jgi:hypothetical protein
MEKSIIGYKTMNNLFERIFRRKTMSEFEKSVVIPLRETLVSKLGFTFDPDDDPNAVFKEIRKGNYFLVFTYEEEQLVLGFWHGNDKQFSPTQRKHFTEILERPEFSSEFSDFLDWEEQWICKSLNCKDWEPNDIIEYLFPRFQLLELTVNVLEID